MTDSWILMDIGCLECEVETQVVGVFSDKGAAEAIRRRLCATHSWRDGGQHQFQIFQMPPPDEVAPPYGERAP